MSHFVLAAEQDRILLNFVRASLQNDELHVITAQSLGDAMARAAAWSASVGVVGTGFRGATVELVRELRREFSMRILVAARPGEEELVARSLEAGAVGFLTIPILRGDLVARVAEMLADAPASDGHFVTAGPVTLDLEKRALIRPRPRTALTPCEFEMLRWFLTLPGRTFTRRQLLASDRAAFSPRAKATQVDRHVESLRRKLGTAGAMIEAAGQVGWRLAMKGTVEIEFPRAATLEVQP
jgi:two-component system phosphate regulon response regulator PhoB